MLTIMMAPLTRALLQTPLELVRVRRPFCLLVEVSCVAIYLLLLEYFIIEVARRMLYNGAKN
jgi:hypothetical protein